MRYLRVGGRRQRHFAETNFEPRKQPENAATPTRRVHAVLGRLSEIRLRYGERIAAARHILPEQRQSTGANKCNICSEE